MIIFGIETSCDETALALIETRGSGTDFECRVISSLVHSQAELHSAYGGVFPTLAKREHGKNLVPLLESLLEEYSIFINNEKVTKKVVTFSGVRKESGDTGGKFDSILESFRQELEIKDPDLYESIKAAPFLKNTIPAIDRIAVTEGPGLEPTLWVGINFARVLGKLWNVPVIPVNHMEGHVVASLLKSDKSHGKWQKLHEFKSPSVALLISGGHTELIKIEAIGQYELIGETKDDAIGEAFDKTARLLGLPYPGGPQLSKLSADAIDEDIKSPIKLPRPMIGSGDLNFSFSGLKTAVLYSLRDREKRGEPMDDNFKKGLAREFEEAVSETVEKKLRLAIEQIGAESIIVGGGVSANRKLREIFEKVAADYGISLFLPSTHTSGDNALMIALAGSLHGQETQRVLKAEGTKRLAK